MGTASAVKLDWNSCESFNSTVLFYTVMFKRGFLVLPPPKAGSVTCWPTYAIYVQGGKTPTNPSPKPHASSMRIVFNMLKVSGIPAQLLFTPCSPHSEGLHLSLPYQLLTTCSGSVPKPGDTDEACMWPLNSRSHTAAINNTR